MQNFAFLGFRLQWLLFEFALTKRNCTSSFVFFTKICGQTSFNVETIVCAKFANFVFLYCTLTKSLFSNANIKRHKRQTLKQVTAERRSLGTTQDYSYCNLLRQFIY